MKKVFDDEYILVFTIGNLKIGLLINAVERVLRAISVDELPGTPKIVTGVVNIGGEVIPVVDFLKRIKNKTKKIIPEDKLIIVRSSSVKFAFFVEDVLGLEQLEKDTVAKSTDIIPGQNKHFDGVTVIKNGVVFIHDVDRFLSLDEEKQLENALEKKKK